MKSHSRRRNRTSLRKRDCSIDAENLTRISCGFIDKIRELIQPSEIYRNTICHGDLWVANFMYKYENSTPISCRIIDFQTFRYAPPAQDFMTYMYLVADKTVRGTTFRPSVTHHLRRIL
ncbi:Ecdysteroid kinase-like family [Popillia japonica]|uniref:Ecdysteroid kinase-like family n=1 Tax=Popillia japonica TaxID=7064 RepID=A0AAW1KRG9_POPJA